MKALIIDEPWIGLILQGRKTWEMRKTVCNHRGRIALIRKGSGQVVGTADVTDSLPPVATAAAYAQAEPRHCIPPERQSQAFDDGWRTPWVLANARPLAAPVPYQHPSGAVIWVNLDDSVAAAADAQPSGTTGTLPTSAPSSAAPPASLAPTTVNAEQPNPAPSAGTTREISVTGGNIRNGHLYLPLDFFPDDVIGGSNKASVAPREITAVFQPGMTVQTDIDRTKRILRDRSAIPDFFVRASVSEGDTVRVTRTASHTFNFEKA